MSSKLFFLISTACLSVLFLNPAYALNKAENSPSYILGSPNQASMLAPAKSADSKTQTLKFVGFQIGAKLLLTPYKVRILIENSQNIVL